MLCFLTRLIVAQVFVNIVLYALCPPPLFPSLLIMVKTRMKSKGKNDDPPNQGSGYCSDSGSQPGVILPPMGYFTTSVDIFGAHNWGGGVTDI